MQHRFNMAVMKQDRAALIELREVSVMQGDTLALDRVSLRIEAGEHVAILGPNGSGKTTLIRMITRECYPLLREGSAVTILGRNRWNVFELRPLLGVVTNDHVAACRREVTALEVVLAGFHSAIELMPYHAVTEEMRRKAGEQLRALGIEHLAGRLMTAMSSGEAQRVVIARALVHEPRALLLDEPSNSLDLRAQGELRDTLRDLARAGTGIILVTHHLADIIPEVERVVLLRGGRVVGDGHKRTLLTAARLRELFGAGVELLERDGFYHLV
ncbi:MAG TPA: ATP-binding cassette domain-containing protein [Bryobacteraceae bacterium]|nr:ATP-binding cassette domain-containing protein [Bryobacteraceae bacterium]